MVKKMRVAWCAAMVSWLLAACFPFRCFLVHFLFLFDGWSVLAPEFCPCMSFFPCFTHPKYIIDKMEASKYVILRENSLGKFMMACCWCL